MSGSNPLVPLANPLAAAQPNVPTVPTAFQSAPGGQHISDIMRGSDQQTMLARRDAAGAELDILSRVMNDTNPKPDEVHDYIMSLIRSGTMSWKNGDQLLQSMPKDSDMLRNWAKGMFGLVMHMGVHGHAAFPREAFPGASPTAAPNEDGEPSTSESTP